MKKLFTLLLVFVLVFTFVVGVVSHQGIRMVNSSGLLIAADGTGTGGDTTDSGPVPPPIEPPDAPT